jgi:hypothetical protein
MALGVEASMTEVVRQCSGLFSDDKHNPRLLINTYFLIGRDASALFSRIATRSILILLADKQS